MTSFGGSALRKGSHPEKNGPRPSPAVPDGPQSIYTSPKLLSMAEADPEGPMSVPGRQTAAQCSQYCRMWLSAVSVASSPTAL